MTDMSVAQTILEQLGGRRFTTMTGARNFTAMDNALSFSIPSKGRDGSNKWRITLMPSDTYRVETFYVRGASFRACSTFEDIYADQLVSLFERTSGLYTRL